MVTKTVSFHGDSAQFQRARAALQSLSGMVAAEVIPGGAAIRVWQGDELQDSALTDILESTGIHGGVISAASSYDVTQ